MITYAAEPLAQWMPDAEPLLPEQWRELADYPDIPLDPDWSWYGSAEKLGSLAIYTARDDGRLVGYALFIWRTSHPHYRRHSWAINDVLWVSPEYRGKGIGTGLADFFENDLRARGVNVVQMRSKTKSEPLAKMLQSRGYSSNEITHSKRL